MAERGSRSKRLDWLVQNRNRLAYELANASERERVTDSYLAKEELMNAFTMQIERLRRTEDQHLGEVGSRL